MAARALQVGLLTNGGGVGLKARPQKTRQLLIKRGTGMLPHRFISCWQPHGTGLGTLSRLPSHHLCAHALSSAKPQVAKTRAAEGAPRFPPGRAHSLQVRQARVWSGNSRAQA